MTLKGSRSRSDSDDIITFEHVQLLSTPSSVICECFARPCCLTSCVVLCCVVLFPPDGTIKTFMRGRPITMFIPSDVVNYDELRTELPAERLKLEWVYPKKSIAENEPKQSCFIRVS